MPLISVVTAFYNTELYLKEAIESILAQDFEDFEFILIDDGSTDQSYQIADSFKDPRLKIFHQTNQGLSKTLNKGIELANSDFIMRLDADDIALPQRMRLQYDFLNSNSDYVAIGSNAIIIDKDGKELYVTKQNLNWESIKTNLPINPFYHSSVMMRKDIVNKCGGYPVSIRHHFEDIVLWNKLSKFGKFSNLAEPLIKYRLVPSALTNRDPRAEKLLINLTNKILNNERIIEKEINKMDNYYSRNMWWKKSRYWQNIGKIYLFKKEKPLMAIKYFIFSILNYPLNFKAYGYFVWGIIRAGKL